MLSNTLQHILHRYSLEQAVEHLGFEAKVVQIIITIIFDIYEEITLQYPFDYFTIKSMVIQSLEKIVFTGYHSHNDKP